MTLSGHVAVAVITLQYIPNPAILLAVNFLAHPLLDAVPHAEWTTFRDSKVKMVLVTVIDALAAIWLVRLAFPNLIVPLWLIIATIIIGLWPDFVDALTGKRWKKFRRWHQFFHTWPVAPNDPVDWKKTITGNTPTWIKLIFQIILIIIALSLAAQ